MVQSGYQLITTGKYSKRIPTDINCYDNDKLFLQLQDLVNPGFKPWYMKQFYRIGNKKVLELAGQARRDGKHKAKYFSQLLKNA